MGDYHTVRLADGSIASLCKLGTMDDYRYVRRSEVERLALTDVGQSADLSRVLTHGSILYRFPWPDEDAHAGSLDHINGRDMFRTFTLPVPPELLDQVEHQDRWVSMGAANQGGAYNVNVAIPCPLAPPFRERGFKNSGATPIFQILGERTDQHWPGPDDLWLRLL